MATQTKASFSFPEIDFSKSFDNSAQQKAMDDLCDRSALIDFTNPTVDLTGAVLTFPIADGKAVYVVTKNRPLTLSHVPVGDEWTIDPALIRGIRRVDVLQQLKRAAFWSRKPIKI